jgi:hypothetical protein
LGIASPLPSTCTPITIGTSVCNLPQNGCDGIFRVGIGRCEEGSASCNILVGGTNCSFTFTYTIPFTNNPDPSANGFRHITQKPSTGGSLIVTASSSFNSMSQIFNSVTPITWINMPVATTEIFGNINAENRIVVDWISVNSVAFEINCQTPSSGLNPTLQLQWSTDGGVTWNNIASTITIDNFSGCPMATIIETAYATVPATAQTAGTLLRIVGQNGGGVGDNPSFTKGLVLQKGSVTNTIGGFIVCVDNIGASNPKTTIRISCASNNPASVSTVTANFNWEAWSLTG